VSDAPEWPTARLGAGRASDEPGAVEELAELCGRLPLALNIAAARAAVWPARPLAGLVTGLRDQRSRLDGLDAGDPTASVRGVSSWACEQLTGPVARMFRLLGVHLGPDITIPAAASLAGIPGGGWTGSVAEGNRETSPMPGQ